MDASSIEKAERLAADIAGKATTQADLNSLMRLMMTSALQRMLDDLNGPSSRSSRR